MSNELLKQTRMNPRFQREKGRGSKVLTLPQQFVKYHQKSRKTEFFVASGGCRDIYVPATETDEFVLVHNIS